MAIRLIKIIVFLFFALLLILPFSQKMLAVENSSRIIVTPPRKNGNGDYLAKIGENNTLSFGICGNTDNKNPAQLTISLTSERYDQNIALHGDYQKAREPNVSCNNTVAYGSAKSFIYKPILSDNGKTKNFTITYKEKEADNLNFADWQFPLLVVEEWPADATEPKDNWASPDLGKFGKMLAINDIFGRIQTNPDIESPQGIVQKILTILLEISAVLALLAFVWSGFQFVTSSGEPGQVEKAKKAMIGAFIGILIIIFAYSIIRAVDIFSSPPSPSSFEEVDFD